MEQEGWVSALTQRTVRWSLDRDILTLVDDDRRMSLAEVRTSQTPTVPDAITVLTVDEIVTPDGPRRLPTLEENMFWSEPRLTLATTELSFSAGCGDYLADLSESGRVVTAAPADGSILAACGPTRSALAAALRLILSGPLTIDREGSFVTITGRDGLGVTGHTSY